jgi:hypothetical protein
MMSEAEVRTIRDALQKCVDDSENNTYSLTRAQLKDVVEALSSVLDLMPAKVPNWK